MLGTETTHNGEGTNAADGAVVRDRCDQPSMPGRQGFGSKASQSVLDTLRAGAALFLKILVPPSHKVLARMLREAREEGAQYRKDLACVKCLGVGESTEASVTASSGPGLKIAPLLTQALLYRHLETAGKRFEDADANLGQGVKGIIRPLMRSAEDARFLDREEIKMIATLCGRLSQAAKAATEGLAQINNSIRIAQESDRFLPSLIDAGKELRGTASGQSEERPRLKRARDRLAELIQSCVDGLESTTRKLFASSSASEDGLRTFEKEIQAQMDPVRNLAVWVDKLKKILLDIEAVERPLQFEMPVNSPNRRPANNEFSKVVRLYRSSAPARVNAVISLIDEALAPELRGESYLEKMRDLYGRLHKLGFDIDSACTRMKYGRDLLSRIDVVLPLESIVPRDSNHEMVIDGLYNAFCRWAVERWTKGLAEGAVTRGGASDLVNKIIDGVTSGDPLETSSSDEERVVADVASFLAGWRLQAGQAPEEVCSEDWARALVEIFAGRLTKRKVVLNSTVGAGFGGV